MTVAVCYKCGAIKHGAWTSCNSCGSMPSTDDDIAISYAMTDHHFDVNTLQKMASDIKEKGEPPHLSPAQKAQLLEKLRSMGVLSMLKKDAAVANRRGTGCLLMAVFLISSVSTFCFVCLFLSR